MGAALYNYYKHGELKSEGSSITEGIGQGRITANLEGAVVDQAYQIPDAEALPVIFNLLSEEGLCLGGSSGINVAGAIRLARELGPGHTIVTVLCDYGTRYQRGCSTPNSCARRGCRCHNGSTERRKRHRAYLSRFATEMPICRRRRHV